MKFKNSGGLGILVGVGGNGGAGKSSPFVVEFPIFASW